MEGDPAAAELLARARALPVTLTFARGVERGLVEALEGALRRRA
jgi:hypothetical protein